MWSRRTNPRGAAGIPYGPTASSDSRTSGSTSTHHRPGMARNVARRRQGGSLALAVALGITNIREVAMGNPDASRSFAAHASDRPAPHGPADRAGLPDSVGRPPAGPVAAPLRAAAGTVNLAAVAAAADQRLDPAARTQEQPGRAFARSASTAHGRHPPWLEYCPGMRARHGVGHGVEPGLGGLGRRRAGLPIRQVSYLAPSKLRMPQSPRARKPVDLWTTQGRCPQAHRLSNISQHQLDSFGRGSGSASPGHRSAVDPQGRSFASASNCAIFARIQTAIHRSAGLSTR